MSIFTCTMLWCTLLIPGSKRRPKTATMTVMSTANDGATLQGALLVHHFPCAVPSMVHSTNTGLLRSAAQQVSPLMPTAKMTASASRVLCLPC